MGDQYRLVNDGVYEFNVNLNAYIFVGNLCGCSFDEFIEEYEHGGNQEQQ